MDEKTTVRISVTLRRERGPEQDSESLLDYLAGAIGEQNGARPPLRLEFPDVDGEPDTGSVYVAELVD